MGFRETAALVLLHLSVVTSQSGGIYDCPDPWLQFDSQCYKFQLYPADLTNAAKECQADGATLVSVNSQGEHNFIADWLTHHQVEPRKWYTSGRKYPGKEVAEWVGDSTEIQGFQFWLSDKDRSQEAGVIVYATDGVNWGWSLVDETKSRPYICEIGRADIYQIITQDRSFGYGENTTDPTKFERGPHFTIEPEDLMYDKDGVYKYAMMECRATGNPEPTYKWYLVERASRTEVDSHQAADYTLLNGKLLIHNPKRAGTYQCMAQNKFGTILSKKAQLSFGYLGQFSKSVRDPVKVNNFGGTGIECSPTKHGYPTILYSWYKNNLNNFIRPDITPYIFISRDGKLYFSSVTKQDEGYYYCMVSSPQSRFTYGGGKQSMPIKLELEDLTPSKREPLIATGFPQIFPSNPKRGDNIHVECFAWGTGDEKMQLDYSWSKEGGVLPRQSTITDQGRVLNIPNIKLSDFGVYTCTCSRRHGGSSTGSVTIPVASAPFSVIPLTDQIVDRGTDLKWRCIWGGTTPKVTWYRNGAELTPDSLPVEDVARFTIERTELVITKVKESDSGMYQCGAFNTYGSQFSSAQLKVLSFKPSFSKYPLQPNLYATKGGNTTIICQPEAAPRAINVWQKDGINLNPVMEPTARVRLMHNGNLRITGVREGDAGKYTCVASNSQGEARSPGLLTVLGSTTIIQYPQDTTVRVNHTAFLLCEASFNPLLDLTYDWYQNGVKIIFYRIKTMGDMVYVKPDPHFKRGTGINRGGLHISSVQFFHSGTYTCEAKTTSDSVSYSAILNVIGPPSQPAGIYAEKATAKTAIVHWSEGGDNGQPITSYAIHAHNLAEDFWTMVKTNIKGPDMIEKTTLVTGLQAYSRYQFRVVAVNTIGESVPSDPSPNITTLAAPPARPPANLGGGGGKVGVLTITWEPLGRAFQNGPNVGYNVSWKKSHFVDEEWDHVRLVGAHHKQHVVRVGTSNFYQEYDVKITSFNKAGYCKQWSNATIYSAEDIPVGVAENVRAFPYNGSAIVVNWKAVPNTREAIKGVLIGYRINYWMEQSQTELMAIFRDVKGDTDSGMIIGLNVETYYRINVQVYNSAGYGPKSSYWIEETLRSAPMDAPVEVSLRSVGPNSVFVKWRGVSTDQQEEPLEGYQVYYWKQGEEVYVAKSVDSMKVTRATVTDLEQNVLYNLRVLGYSRAGTGLFSSPTLQFVVGENCLTTEESPEKEYVYRCDGCGVTVSSVLLLAALSCHLVTRWL